MARILFIVAWAISLACTGCSAAFATEVTVLSGDIVRIDTNEWRVANIVAPSIVNTCENEIKLGLLAQAKLAEFLAQGELEIRPTGGFDIHHRRMAYLSINGEDVGEKMLAVGLAQRYGQARPLCGPASKGRSGPDNMPSQLLPPYAPPPNQPRPVR